MTPTQRTLAECKARGWVPWVAERWNAHAKIRQDAFGIIDIIALAPGKIIGIQATSGANVAARVDKLEKDPASKAWVEAGGTLAVWGWRKVRSSKVNKDGKRSKRMEWQVRVIPIVPA